MTAKVEIDRRKVFRGVDEDCRKNILGECFLAWERSVHFVAVNVG
jgi:hypothetical protein